MRREPEKFLTNLKREYQLSDVVMSEFLRNYKTLSKEEKEELLKYAGEDDFMMVNEQGEIVEKPN